MRTFGFLLCALALASSSFAQARPAVAVDGLVYLSAVAGDKDDGAITGDVKAQAAQALMNVDARLKAAGSSLANTASVLVVLKSGADFAAMNEVFAQHFPKDPPARTTIVMDGALAKPGAAIELSVVGIPTGGERVVVHPSGWMKSPSPYSYGIKSGNTLFLAGLVSRNPVDNTAVAGDIAAQTKVVMESASTILKAAGMTLADVVTSRVYLSDAAMFGDMNNTYRTFFPASPPARATVKAGLNSAANLIEITMVAVKDPARKTITTPNADGTPGRPNANLSSAIQVGKRLYVAGLTGATPATKDDVKAQTTEVLARLERTMKAAGYSWADVVDEMVFLPNMAKMADVEAAQKAVYPGAAPARGVVGTPLMGGDAAVEIMLTAVKK